jgi:hypothetical protein
MSASKNQSATSPAVVAEAKQVNMAPRGADFDKEASKLTDLQEYMQYVRRHWNILSAYRQKVFKRGQSMKDIVLSLEKELKDHWKVQ